MLVAKPAGVHFAAFGRRGVVCGSMSQRRVESIFHRFQVGSDAPEKRVVGECESGGVATREYVDLDSGKAAKADGLLRAALFRRNRRDWIRDFEAVFPVAFHQAECELSLYL